MPALDISINPAGARIGAQQVVVALNSVQRSAAQTTASVNKGFNAMALTMARVQRILVGIAVGGAFALLSRAIRDTISTIADFEQGMAEVRSVTQVTGQAFDQLAAKARQLGATTRFTATEAAKGMAFLGRAGFETDEILAAIPATLDLASAGMLGLGEAADIVSNVMQGFGLQADLTRFAVDVMAQTAANSNTNIQQLGQAMKFVAPIARSLGVSIEETSTLIGALGNAGIQAGRAGTGLRRIMAALVNPSKQARDAIKNAGLSLEDLNIRSKGIIEVLGNLKNANLNATEAFQIFGLRGATPVLALIDQLGPKFDRLRQDILNATGASREMARVLEDTLSGSFRRVAAATESAVIAVGEGGLKGAFRDTSDVTADMIAGAEDTAGFFGKLGGLVTRAGAVVAQGTIDMVKNMALLGGAASAFVTAPFLEEGFEKSAAAMQQFVDGMDAAERRTRRLLGIQTKLNQELELERELAKQRLLDEAALQREAVGLLAGGPLRPTDPEAAAPEFRGLLRGAEEESSVQRRLQNLRDETALAGQLSRATQEGIATREASVRAINRQIAVTDALKKVRGQTGDLTKDEEKEIRALATTLFKHNQVLKETEERNRAVQRSMVAFTKSITDQAIALNRATEQQRIVNETVGNPQERAARLAVEAQVERMRQRGTAATNAQREALLQLARVEQERIAQRKNEEDAERKLIAMRAQATQSFTNLAAELNTLTRQEEISRISDPAERRVQLELLKQQNQARLQGRSISQQELSMREKLIRKNDELTESIKRNRSQLQEFSETGVTLFEAINEAATNAFKGAEDAIVEFAKTGRISFTEMIDSMLEDLLRMLVRTQITAPLSGALNNILQGGNVGQNVQQGISGSGGGGLLKAGLGLLGSFLGGGGGGGVSAAIAGGAVGGTTLSGSFIPDFQQGGIVPGPMGKKRLITAEGGERILTPRQQRQDGNVNITMNISTPDAPSFQRSQDQILARMQVGLSRASRRNN